MKADIVGDVLNDKLLFPKLIVTPAVDWMGCCTLLQHILQLNRSTNSISEPWQWMVMHIEVACSANGICLLWETSFY